MAKTLITTQPNSQIVVHDSDGKNSPLASSAGQSVSVITGTAGKVISVHGQVAGTTVIHNNPS